MGFRLHVGRLLYEKLLGVMDLLQSRCSGLQFGVSQLEAAAGGLPTSVVDVADLRTEACGRGVLFAADLLLASCEGRFTDALGACPTCTGSASGVDASVVTD